MTRKPTAAVKAYQRSVFGAVPSADLPSLSFSYSEGSCSITSGFYIVYPRGGMSLLVAEDYEQGTETTWKKKKGTLLPPENKIESAHHLYHRLTAKHSVQR